jgi:hypothetical protein
MCRKHDDLFFLNSIFGDVFGEKGIFNQIKSFGNNINGKNSPQKKRKGKNEH